MPLKIIMNILFFFLNNLSISDNIIIFILIFLYAFSNNFIKLSPLLSIKSSSLINKTNSERVLPYNKKQVVKKIKSGKFDKTFFAEVISTIFFKFSFK